MIEVPERQIAPYTTVQLMPSGNHIQLTAHNEHRIELDRDAVGILMQWLHRAGFMPNNSWPGSAP